MYDFAPPAIEWSLLMPVILVICAGLLGLIYEMALPKRINDGIIGMSVVGLLGSLGTLIWQLYGRQGETLAGMVMRDRMSVALQIAIVGITLLTIFFSEPYLRQKRIPFGEFYPMLCWSAAGGMIMVSTTNLLMFFIGLEVLSVALYVLAGMARSEKRSEESAIKYFLLGAFATGFLLYGIAFIFGATGSLDIGLITTAWATNDVSVRTMLVFGLGLILVALGFKSALVPFHAWAPDVYQGAPTNVTAFMAAAVKVAALGGLLRILSACTDLSAYWLPVLQGVAILSMVIGNVLALVQRDVKRMLAYSSIANAGYVLVGIISHGLAPTNVGYSTTVFYLVSYSLMTVGTFGIVTLTAKRGAEGTRFEDLNGLYQRHPFAAVCLIVFVASLIGVPPTAGFFGKLMIFNDAVASGQTALAIVLAACSVISVYYYLNLVLAAFVNEDRERSEATAPMNIGLAFSCAACLIGVLGLSFVSSPIINYIGAAR